LIGTYESICDERERKEEKKTHFCIHFCFCFWPRRLTPEREVRGKKSGNKLNYIAFVEIAKENGR
jgi:hypothetical protein